MHRAALREVGKLFVPDDLMTSFLRWLFPPTSLDGIDAPTRVKVEGIATGEDASESLVTGRRGVVLEYRFWDRSEITNRRGRTKYDDRRLAFGRIGDSLLLDVAGTLLLVPITRDIDIEFAGHWDPGMLPALLPDAIVEAHPAVDRFTEELRYDEKALHTGQRVRVTAHVEPVQKAAESVYRGGRGAPWDFVVRPDLGRVRVKEL
jgi:hypothetical protein